MGCLRQCASCLKSKKRNPSLVARSRDALAVLPRRSHTPLAVLWLTVSKIARSVGWFDSRTSFPPAHCFFSSSPSRPRLVSRGTGILEMVSQGALSVGWFGACEPCLFLYTASSAAQDCALELYLARCCAVWESWKWSVSERCRSTGSVLANLENSVRV